MTGTERHSRRAAVDPPPPPRWAAGGGGPHSGSESARGKQRMDSGATSDGAARPPGEPASWSAGQLKRFLAARCVDTTGCTEKGELVALAQRELAREGAAGGGSAPASGLEALRKQLRKHTQDPAVIEWMVSTVAALEQLATQPGWEHGPEADDALLAVGAAAARVPASATRPSERGVLGLGLVQRLLLPALRSRRAATAAHASRVFCVVAGLEALDPGLLDAARSAHEALLARPDFSEFDRDVVRGNLLMCVAPGEPAPRQHGVPHMLGLVSRLEAWGAEPSLRVECASLLMAVDEAAATGQGGVDHPQVVDILRGLCLSLDRACGGGKDAVASRRELPAPLGASEVARIVLPALHSQDLDVVEAAAGLCFYLRPGELPPELLARLEAAVAASGPHGFALPVMARLTERDVLRQPDEHQRACAQPSAGGRPPSAGGATSGSTARPAGEEATKSAAQHIANFANRLYKWGSGPRVHLLIVQCAQWMLQLEEAAALGPGWADDPRTVTRLQGLNLALNDTCGGSLRAVASQPELPALMGRHEAERFLLPALSSRVPGVVRAAVCLCLGMRPSELPSELLARLEEAVAAAGRLSALPPMAVDIAKDVLRQLREELQQRAGTQPGAGSSGAAQAGPATAERPPGEPASWSAGQLKRFLAARRVNTTGCAEKGELVALVQQELAREGAAGDGSSAAPAAGAAGARPARRCAECGALRARDGSKLKTCRRCRLAWYCGDTCQQKNWPGHRRHCRLLRDLAAETEGGARAAAAGSERFAALHEAAAAEPDGVVASALQLLGVGRS